MSRAKLRSTVLFKKIVQSMRPHERLFELSPARTVHALFMSDSTWRPGHGAVIWNPDDRADLEGRDGVIQASRLADLRHKDPDLLLMMLENPVLRRVLIVDKVDDRTGDMRVIGSVAEAALMGHGDVAARTILSSEALREEPAMRPLGWDPDRSSGPPPREGCLAFQALDYVGDLSMTLEFPEVWNLPVAEDEDGAQTWLERAAQLAELRNDRALFHIREVMKGAAPKRPGLSL